jgi:hypothetical protein
LQIGRLDREGDLLALFLATALVRRSGSKSCIESDVGRRSFRGTGGNVSTAFTFSSSLGATTALSAGETIKLAFDASRNESFADLDLIAALPPARLKRIQSGLAGGFSLALLSGVLDRLSG